MATIREIMTSAFRKAKILASGETPAGIEADDALALIQALILEHPGLVNTQWRDVFATSEADITVKDGQRITVGAFTPVIIFPTSTTDLWKRRDQRDLSRAVVVGGYKNGLWLYSDDGWLQADALDLDSENPFGRRSNNGLAAQLAVKLADEYGGSVGQSTAIEATRSEKSIRSRLWRDYYRDMRIEDHWGHCPVDYA